MDSEKFMLCCDTREPEPHPWQRWIGDAVTWHRGWPHGKLKKPTCLPTGDFCGMDAFSYDDAADDVAFEPKRLIERKTAADFYGCCTSNRERFSSELIRILDLRLIRGTQTMIVVESSWPEVLEYACGQHAMAESALRETVRAWERRFCPIVFCDNERAAAWWSLQFLKGAM